MFFQGLGAPAQLSAEAQALVRLAAPTAGAEQVGSVLSRHGMSRLHQTFCLYDGYPCQRHKALPESGFSVA